MREHRDGVIAISENRIRLDVRNIQIPGSVHGQSGRRNQFDVRCARPLSYKAAGDHGFAGLSASDGSDGGVLGIGDE